VKKERSGDSVAESWGNGNHSASMVAGCELPRPHLHKSS
jgi:hypothetical protein